MPGTSRSRPPRKRSSRLGGSAASAWHQKLYRRTGRSHSQPHILQSERVLALIAVLEILRVLVTDVDAHRSAALPLPVRGHRAPQRHVQVGTLDMQPSTGDRPAGRTISRNRRAAGTARLKRRRRATEAASSVPSAQALDPLESGHAKVGSSLSPMIPKGTSAVLQLQQSRHRTCLQGRP